MTISQAKTKDLYENLQKKYTALKEQHEILKKDTHIPQAPESILPQKEVKDGLSIYTGVTFFHLIIAFLLGVLLTYFFKYDCLFDIFILN